MDKYTFFTTLRDAIHDDSATQTWVSARYSRNHSVYTMTNSEALPDADTVYPIVEIRVSGGTWGYDEDNEGISFRVKTTLKIETTKTTGKARAVEYQGMEYILAFTRLVMQSLVGALPAGSWVDSASESYSGNDKCPLFECTTDVSIYTPYSQGDTIV